MAYFWDYIAHYPVESGIIITVGCLIYFGWIKKFWYVYRPPLYCTSKGWRIKRYIGRIVKFETENGDKILSKSYADQVEKEKVVILIYIRGQPLRRMTLRNTDIWSIKRVPRNLFIKQYIMGKRYIVWNAEDNTYELTDDRTRIYLIKPDIFERQMLRKIDNIDIKATRGSRASPQLVHSGYFTQHLAIPPDEYQEKEKELKVTEYDYMSDKMGSYGDYLEEDEEDFPEDDELEEDTDV